MRRSPLLPVVMLFASAGLAACSGGSPEGRDPTDGSTPDPCLDEAVADADGDGEASEACGGPDCDDDDAAVHLGVDDTSGDGVDTNCDGTDGIDFDGDGHASIETGGDDCDDLDDAAHPEAPDTRGDDVDQDCDGVDGTDGDADGHASEASGGDDCDDVDPLVHPGASDGGHLGTTSLFSGWSTSGISVALDPDGEPVIAFGEVYLSGSTVLCRVDVVRPTVPSSTVEATGASGCGAAVAVDATGVVHLAFGSSPGLRYSTDASGSWATETIAPGGYAAAIGMDGAGVLHVVRYDDGAVSELRRSTSGAWSEVPITTTDGFAWAAVGADGIVHVVTTGASGALRYATDASGSWVEEPLGASTTEEPDIAVGPDGAPHVAYWDDAVLTHAWRTATGWTSEEVTTMSSSSSTDLEVGADGGLHLSFHHSGGYYVSRPAGGAWGAPLALGTAMPQLAIDSDRQVLHLAHADGGSVYSSVIEPPNGVDDDCDGEVY